MNKHTPGPWKVKCVPTSIGRCFKVGPESIIEMGHGAICLYDDDTSLNPLPHDEIEANARLIAAAPELLEAAEVALAVLAPELERSGVDGFTLHAEGVAVGALRAAIAQAKSE